MSTAILDPRRDRVLPRGGTTWDRPLQRQPQRSELFSHAGRQFVAGWPVIWPMLAVSVASLLLRLTPLDLAISAVFYDPVSQAWPWFYSPVCTGFYRGGTYPAFGLALIGLVMGTCGLLSPRRREQSLRAGTFLWVAFVVGPGLIVNCGFKEAWGRPRPHQVEQFGGPHRFVPVGTPSLQQPQNSSFPSGHAAVAFFLIAPAFVVDRQRPRLARALLTAGLVFGTAMSAVRVVQGGHFASDVLWSAAIVYLTCVVCARLLLHPRCAPDVRPSSGAHANTTGLAVTSRR